MHDPSSVSAVICTMNSVKSLESCLSAARSAGIGKIIVVDANSQDGTRQIAEELADLVITDSGLGLGNARNMGISETTSDLVLNLGSDNVISRESLNRMIAAMEEGRYHGVGALTQVTGNSYLSRSINVWWRARFRPGEVSVIGTPSLFNGPLLRQHPFNTNRQHSDDSELCERWSREFNSRFAISDAIVEEVGKSDKYEIRLRAMNYGFSDSEIFKAGSAAGWSMRRKITSILHPLRVDLFSVIRHSHPKDSIVAAPFLLWFVGTRYRAWVKNS